MQQKIIFAQGFRLSEMDNEKEVGRAYLYLLRNDLHDRSFGLLEDVYVEESHRGHGIASKLLQQVIRIAREQSCYKLLATSRNDGTRSEVHDWYERLGFQDYGVEFRINL